MVFPTNFQNIYQTQTNFSRILITQYLSLLRNYPVRIRGWVGQCQTQSGWMFGDREINMESLKGGLVSVRVSIRKQVCGEIN